MIILGVAVSAPIDIPGQDFTLVRYIDGTLVIMNGSSDQVQILMDTLEDCAKSTGLRVGFAKSCMVPLNCPDHLTQALVNQMGCRIGQLPFG